MKNEPVFKEINDKLLKRYEISETGVVRIAIEKRIIPSFFDKNRRDCVSLICRGRKKKYFIKELLMKTFNIKRIEDESIAHIDFLAKPDQFSANEEDYGRNENSIHWQKIKELGKKATYNKNKEENNLD